MQSVKCSHYLLSFISKPKVEEEGKKSKVCHLQETKGMLVDWHIKGKEKMVEGYVRKMDKTLHMS
jgi:hypothetical protein